MNSIEGAAGAMEHLEGCRGIRVVSLDREAAVHAGLRSSLEHDVGFVLVGESREWNECEELLNRFVPELLIANTRLIPLPFLEGLAVSAFPVLVELRTTGCGRSATSPFATLSIPVESERLHVLLNRLRSEICTRKADELSALLQRYMTSIATCEQHLSKLKVEDGDNSQEVPAEDILLFAADGNYIRVHTNNRVYAIRETMTGICAKLDPAQFARVHRSYIVNLSHVADVVTREGSSTCVLLSSGMEVPVGPNYRAEFSSAAETRNRLIA